MSRRRDYDTMGEKTLRVAVCVFFFTCCALSLTGCGKKETKAVAEKITNVRVQAAGKISRRPYVTAVGTLMPDEEVVASSEVDGVVRTVSVDDGSAVAKGQLLAAVDDTDYRREVEKAQAAFRQAEATLENTKLEFKRKESLHQEELVTKQQFEDVSTRLALATADLERTRAALSQANEKLAKTKIYSPLGGVIKEKKISAGNFVKNATPLFAIIRIDPLKLDFTITETDTGKIRVGQDVGFTVDAIPGRVFNGRVSIIYPHLDEKTRTLKVQALVPNHDRVLKPGLFSRVTLYTGPARDIVVVPVTALLYEESTIKIFIVNGMKAHVRPVKIGSTYGDLMEIVKGLKENEMVVTVGQNTLAEGAKVNVAR